MVMCKEELFSHIRTMSLSPTKALSSTALSPTSLLNLTLYEAHRLVMDTAYNSFIKALGRRRRAYDCHVLTVPQIKQKVLTCRILGTGKYISPNNIARQVTPYDVYPELRKTRKRPITTYMYIESDNTFPVDIHYDVMSEDKRNIVTVRDLIDILSVRSTENVPLLDCIRLYFLRRPPIETYFTENQFIEESKANVDFLRLLEYLMNLSRVQDFPAPVENRPFSYLSRFRTIYRSDMLAALDINWYPSMALAITNQYIQDIKSYTDRGKLSRALFLEILKDISIYLHPFVPDTACQIWKTLRKPNDLFDEELSEQPMPTDLSYLSGSLRVTFYSQNGATIRTNTYSLTPEEVESLDAEWVKLYIGSSSFFKHWFLHKDLIKSVCVTPGDYDYGHVAKVVMFHPDEIFPHR